MAKPKIYLAGAITALPSRGATWRDQVTELLSPLQVINPLRIELPGHAPHQIIRADLGAIRDCQALLVNADRPSWGTAMEIWQAREWRIPNILFNVHFGEDAFKPSPWLLYCATETHQRQQDAVDSLRERFSAHL